jgi:hypothetical protein
MIAGADKLEISKLYVTQRAVKGSRKSLAGRPVVNESLRGLAAVPPTAGPTTYTTGGFREVLPSRYKKKKSHLGFKN